MPTLVSSKFQDIEGGAVKPEGGNPNSSLGGLKVSWRTGIWILLITLAVWIYFYVKQMQLDQTATVVVALAATVLVVVAQWLWSRIRRSRENKSGGAK
jgi:type VI protein secretion system component VasK